MAKACHTQFNSLQFIDELPVANILSSSNGRRLFPQRRPALSSLFAPDLHAVLDNAVNNWDFQATLEDDSISSDESNSSPCGSVKINRLSKLEWPGPREAFDTGSNVHELATFGAGSTSRYDRNELIDTCRTSQLGDTVPISSLGDEQGIDLDDQPLQILGSADVDKAVNREELLSTENHTREASQASVQIAQRTSSTGCSIHDVKKWDGTSKIWTVLTSLEDQKIQVNHLAQLTIIVPDKNIDTKRFSFEIIVRNAQQVSNRFNLTSRQTSLYFVATATAEEAHQDAIFTVVRDVQDMELHLDLYLSFVYNLNEHREYRAIVPNLQPQTGQMRAESVYIASPYPPLKFTPITRREFSTWKNGHESTDQVTHYERTSILRLYPERFSDDVRLEISDPCPTPFEALKGLDIPDVVWDFHMTVDRLLDDQFICRMSLLAQVGVATRLLNIDSHGWIPQYSIINGRIATHEWRQIGGMTLFKSPDMIDGLLRVEVIWHKERDSGSFRSALPTVTDMKVLSGILISQVDRSEEDP